MTQPKTPAGKPNEISFVKISNEIGGGHDSSFTKLYADYENTPAINGRTSFNLEPHEIEIVLAKSEVKKKVADDENFKSYLSQVIKNSLDRAKQTCDANHSHLKSILNHLKVVTDSTHLSDLLKTILSAV